MKEICWSQAKNAFLARTRDVTFEQLLNSRFIGIEQHRIKTHQRLMLFEFEKRVWVVPYVEDKDHYFLKTAFPSRKLTKKYQGG